MFRITVGLVGAALLTIGCHRQVMLEPYRAEFVYTTLAFQPSLATSAGFDRWGGDVLDEKLDDWGEVTVEKRREFYYKHRKAMEEIPRELLSPEERDEHTLIIDWIKREELDLNRIRPYKYDARVYVDAVADGLVSLYVSEQGEKKLRYFDLVRRLEATPRLVEIAKKNLVSVPVSWNVEAQKRIKTLVAFIDGPLREDCAPELKPKFEEHASKAMAALKDLQTWLDTVVGQTQMDWRLDPMLYEQRFQLSMGGKESLDEWRRAGEGEIAALRSQMETAAGKGGVKKALSELKTAAVDVPLVAGMAKSLRVRATPAAKVPAVPLVSWRPGPVVDGKEAGMLWVTAGPAREADLKFAVRSATKSAEAGDRLRRLDPRSRAVLHSLFDREWKRIEWPTLTEIEGMPADEKLAVLNQLLEAAAVLVTQIEIEKEWLSPEDTVARLKQRTYRDEAGAKQLALEIELGGRQIPAGFAAWREISRRMPN